MKTDRELRAGVKTKIKFIKWSEKVVFCKKLKNKNKQTYVKRSET